MNLLPYVFCKLLNRSLFQSLLKNCFTYLVFGAESWNVNQTLLPILTTIRFCCAEYFWRT